MKKITLFTVLSILLAFTSCDKEEVTPKQITDAFAKKFPTATDVEWDKESDTEWEAEFKMDDKEYSSNFSTSGEWLETEYEIEENEIPENIKLILNENVSEYTIETAEIAETKEGISYEFEIEIEIDNKEYDITIDPKGNFKKEEIKEENED